MDNLHKLSRVELDVMDANKTTIILNMYSSFNLEHFHYYHSSNLMIQTHSYKALNV